MKLVNKTITLSVIDKNNITRTIVKEITINEIHKDYNDVWLYMIYG